MCKLYDPHRSWVGAKIANFDVIEDGSIYHYTYLKINNTAKFLEILIEFWYIVQFSRNLFNFKCPIIHCDFPFRFRFKIHHPFGWGLHIVPVAIMRPLSVARALGFRDHFAVVICRLLLLGTLVMMRMMMSVDDSSWTFLTSWKWGLSLVAIYFFQFCINSKKIFWFNISY